MVFTADMLTQRALHLYVHICLTVIRWFLPFSICFATSTTDLTSWNWYESNQCARRCVLFIAI